MNKREENLATTLAEITAAHKKLEIAHLRVTNELSEIKAAMKRLSQTLASSSDEMVDLSHRSLGASLKLLGLLRVAASATEIDPPSIEEIEDAKMEAIHAAENVTNAANSVSYSAHEVYAYMHASSAA
jgi:chromosome segregation ATPase